MSTAILLSVFLLPAYIQVRNAFRRKTVKVRR